MYAKEESEQAALHQNSSEDWQQQNTEHQNADDRALQKNDDNDKQFNPGSWKCSDVEDTCKEFLVIQQRIELYMHYLRHLWDRFEHTGSAAGIVKDKQEAEFMMEVLDGIKTLMRLDEWTTEQWIDQPENKIIKVLWTSMDDVAWRWRAYLSG